MTVENCINDLLAVAEWIEDTFPIAEKFIFATSFGGYISLLSLSRLQNYKVILRAPAVTMPKVLLGSVLKIFAEQIEKLEKQARAEKQPKKKFEFVQQIKELKRKMVSEK